ncbi:MAG: efflux RND transporter periplasmic adaptor subunit, partial [Candidatus Anammoxibacter sp.]
MNEKKQTFFIMVIPIVTAMFFSGFIIFIESSLSSFVWAENHQHSDKDVIRISKEEIEEFDIKVTTARPGKLKRYVELPGEIVPAPERLAHMIPRFPGVVQEIRKKIGDKVEQGEVLAIIENNESLVPYEVKSLINGVVMDIHLTRGEVTGGASGNVGITVEKQQGFIIADLSTVWVNLSVYQKDVHYVHVGNEVVIYAGPDIPETVGKISYVTPFLNEKTRTATARVILPNPDGYWKPGLFVTGRVT